MLNENNKIKFEGYRVCLKKIFVEKTAHKIIMEIIHNKFANPVVCFETSKKGFKKSGLTVLLFSYCY